MNNVETKSFVETILKGYGSRHKSLKNTFNVFVLKTKTKLKNN